jgi:hypothetical protein
MSCLWITGDDFAVSHQPLWITKSNDRRTVPPFWAMTGSVWLDSPRAIEEHLRRDVPLYDLESPGVRFIMCAPDNQVMAHAQISDPTDEDLHDEPDDGLGTGSSATITRFLSHFGSDLGSVLVALTRPGRAGITEDDRACYRAAHAICSAHGVRLLGVHVVTPRGQREVVLDDVL